MKLALALCALLTLSSAHAAPPADPIQEIPTSELIPLSKAPATQFAFLCLNDTKLANPEAIKAALVKWFQLKSADEIRRFTIKPDTHSLSWGIGRSRFVATLEALPIPADDIGYAATNSLHWPDAEAKMRQHQANFTLTCDSIQRDAWLAALDLTHALAALAETHDTAGIYWGDASILHEPASFLKQASYQSTQPANEAPSSLWVGILFESNNQGGWNIFTDGMEPLGYRDLEIHNSQLARTQLFELLSTLKHQILTHQFTAAEDATFTTATGEKWVLHTGKSIIGKQKPIWTLTQQGATPSPR